MKIFELAEKHKSIIAASVTVLFIAVFSVLMYKTNVEDKNNKPVKSYTIGQINSIDDTVFLEEGQTLVQNYKNVGLNYKEIGFVAHAQTNEAVIEVEISDTKQSQKQVFSQDKLSDGYTYFEIDERLQTSNEAALKIVFYAKKGNLIIAANKSQHVEGSSCYIGENNSDSNIVIDLRTVRQEKSNYKYIIIAAAITAFLAAMAVVIKFIDFNIQGLTAITLSFFCMVCLFIFPPFTVPDEKTHYLSAYHISNLQMLDFSDKENGLVMRECDYEYMESSSNSLYGQWYVTEKGFDKFLAENVQTVTTDYDYMTNKAVPYFFSGLGITAARILGIGSYWTFQLSRLFNAAMCIVLLYFAIKIIPYGKCALAAISLIPMYLHIMASCSYDCFTFGGVTLLFAYIVSLMCTDKKIGWRQLLILTAMIVLVIPQKVVYIGVAAILLLIPKDKFKKPKWHFFFKCCLGGIAVISILLFQVGNASKVVSDVVTNSETAGFSIGYVLNNPVRMVKMLFETVLGLGDFYLKSFISYFGWFEFEAPWFMAVPYVVVLSFAFMRRKGEPAALGIVQRTYSLALFFIVFLLTELLLLLDHTPMDSTMILGVQGRYFLPALPLVFLFARNNTIELNKSFDKKLLFLLSALNGYMFVFCTAKII